MVSRERACMRSEHDSFIRVVGTLVRVHSLHKTTQLSMFRIARGAVLSLFYLTPPLLQLQLHRQMKIYTRFIYKLIQTRLLYQFSPFPVLRFSFSLYSCKVEPFLLQSHV